MESGGVGIYVYAAGKGLRGVTASGRHHGGGGTPTTESPLLLRRMRAALFLGGRFALDREALAFFFALLLRCCALPPKPRRTNGPAFVAVANAKALQMPLPPKPG